MATCLFHPCKVQLAMQRPLSSSSGIFIDYMEQTEEKTKTTNADRYKR